MSTLSWKTRILDGLRLRRRRRGFWDSVKLVDIPTLKPTEDTKTAQRNHIPLLDLSNELFLTIADFLDQDSQLSLSLSCKRLRILLDSSLGPVYSTSMKLRILDYFARYDAGYITCPACVRVFQWHGKLSQDCRCPYDNASFLSYRSNSDTLTTSAWFMQGNPSIWMSPEVVDLILEARLPLSFLATEGTGADGVYRKSEARFADGSLILATNWAVDATSERDLAPKTRLFRPALCLHSHIWLRLEETRQKVETQSYIYFYDCTSCATEYELGVTVRCPERRTIFLITWRNYGHRRERTLVRKHMFPRNPPLQSRRYTASPRELRIVFERYGVGEDDRNRVRWLR